jgi:PAS domain S-box-containing protein
VGWRTSLLVGLNVLAFAVLAAVIWHDGRVLARQWVEVQRIANEQRWLDGVRGDADRLRGLIHRYFEARSDHLGDEIAAGRNGLLDRLTDGGGADPVDTRDRRRLAAIVRQWFAGFEAVRDLDSGLRAFYRDHILDLASQITADAGVVGSGEPFSTIMAAVNAFYFTGDRGALGQARQQLATLASTVAAKREAAKNEQERIAAAQLADRLGAFWQSLERLDREASQLAMRLAHDVDDVQTQLSDIVGHRAATERLLQMDAQLQFDQVLSSVGRMVALFGFGFLLVTVGVSVIIARSIRQPIHELASEIAAIAAGDLHRRIPGTGFPDEIGAIARTLSVLKDNAQAKQRIETQLESQERRWRTVLETSPIGFSIIAADDHRRLYANPKCREILGLTGPDLSDGLPLRDSFVTPAAFDELQRRLEQGEVISGFEVERRRPDGSTWWSVLEIQAIDIDGRPSYMVWHYDVTARRRFEEELRTAKERAEAALEDLRAAQRTLVQSEKMASLGGLVAGIAHEINTPLGISLTSASLLAEESRRLSETMTTGSLRRSDLARFLSMAQESSDLLLANSQRAADLIKSFKQVAVDQAADDCRWFNLREYIDEVLMSLGPRLKRSALTVTIDCPADIDVQGFPGAVAQILTNFVMNSLTHAFDPGQPGRLAVTVTLPEPDRVRLVFRDNGRGIPETVLPKIFDPFFTTNRSGGGSGLGLNIVYNLVRQQLGGDILVTSVAGEGTTFTVSFPRVIGCPTGDGKA